MSIVINGTSGISGVDGSAGTPALQGTDTNTGISFDTDTVNINTGGTTRATVDSSGRLLVGTSTARSNFFASVASQLQIEGTTSPNSALSLTRNSNDASCALLYFAKSRAGSVGGNTVVANGDQLGIISWQGADGTTLRAGAAIEARVDGTPGASDMPTRLVFSTTADGASSPTERMRICSTSSNSDLLYLNCTGRTNTAPNTTGGRIWQTNGNCKIRTADTSAAFQFYSATGGTSSAVGSIVVNASSTSYNTSSDYRLKENVVDLDGAITRVKQLAPKRFNFIADEADTTVDGFLAHEAQTVVPEAVTGTHNEVDDDGNPVMQGIDQAKLVPLLTAALQEAIAKIETLETTNASQAATIAALDARLTALEGGTN